MATSSIAAPIESPSFRVFLINSPASAAKSGLSVWISEFSKMFSKRATDASEKFCEEEIRKEKKD